VAQVPRGAARSVTLTIAAALAAVVLHGLATDRAGRLVLEDAWLQP
jgi:hypothetical protein